MKYLFLVLFLIGCSDQKRVVTVRDIDPELETYVTSFEHIYNVHVNYSIKFENLPGNQIGECRGFRSPNRKIVIDSDFYSQNKNNYAAIELVVFHELGHCSLNRGHDTSFKLIPISGQTYGDVIPTSIMYPTFNASYLYYLKYLEYYRKELAL